jgi:hypothetical protein
LSAVMRISRPLDSSATIWSRNATNSGLTMDFATFGIQRIIERERVLPIVLEAGALGSPKSGGNTGSRRS